MLKKITHLRLALLTLLVILVLTAAQCGSAPAKAPAKETATVAPTATVVEPTKEQPTKEAETEATVQKSEAAVAVEKKGISVMTNEPDVSQPRTKLGGEYHDVDTSDAVSFHPYLTSDTSSSAYQGLVYAGNLLTIDEKTLEYKPYMAEKYEISDDGLTFTFYLRKGLKWSDGKPLTAQDFKWTFDQVMDPKNEYPYLSQMRFIKSYEALDDNTIQAKIDEVYAPALSQIALFITPLPKHIWEKLSWGDPEKNPEINKPSVVSGPYKLVEWKRDQSAIFEANPNYWFHGAPNIQKYIIEIVPDQDVAFQKLKSNQVDTSSMTPEQLQEARKLDNVTVYEWWPASATWSYIGLNMREGFATSDINIRHGISYAIDKELLTEQVWLGQAKRLCSIFPPTSWAYNPDVPCYDYSQEKALEAFSKAGYTLKDDKLVNSKGEQLTLKFLYGPNTSPTSELLAVSVQDALKKVGIEVKVEGLEWASFLDATKAEKPTWDMFLGGWRSTIEPQTSSTIWAAENIPQLNAVAYNNPKVEDLFKEAGGTYDTAARKQKYGAIQKIISDDSPYVFLAYRKSASAQNKRIKGLVPTALGIGWNQEDWYIEK